MNAEKLAERVMVGLEPAMRKRVEAARDALAESGPRASFASVIRYLVELGLDALEQKQQKRRPREMR